MRLFWRTKPAADEFVDITDHSRAFAIKEATYQAFADSASRVLRISGKPRLKGESITAPVERLKVR